MNDIIQILMSNRLLLFLLLFWSIVWKGIALWKSARNKQVIWFVAILIVNTLGIIEIIYISFFRKNQGNTL